MGTRGIGWQVFLAAWIVLLAVACPPARAAESYLTDAGEAARAVGLVTGKHETPLQLHSLRITDHEITMAVRGGTHPTHLDEWRVRRGRVLFLFDAERVSGPVARVAPLTVADAEAGFFLLDGIALDAVSTVVTQAIGRAKLEGTATVQSIEIARRIHPLPKPSYGDIRWSVYVATPHESAVVFADADGNIVGVDLSNTKRARLTNFITDDDWPKQTAVKDLLVAIGDGRQVRDVTIYPNYIQVKVDHPTNRRRTQGYSWDLSGVTHSVSMTPLFPTATDEELFSLAQMDVEPLADIREAARKAWNNETSRINYMMLRRFADGPGGPELRWTVSFQDIGEGLLIGGSGAVDLDTAGRVKATRLPAYRATKRDWLDPAAAVEALATLDGEFRTAARFAEISISRQNLQILAEVPDQPGTMRNYHMNEAGIGSSDMIMPWDAQFRPERLFTMEDLAFFSAERLEELTRRTAARLHTSPDMAVSRYTFSVGQLMGPDGNFMVPSPDGKVTLEIRIDTPDGFRGGRVTYSSTGEEIDVVMP